MFVLVGGFRDRHCVSVPLADSFLVLMIFAAYSCPEDFFTHLRTTEKAPLGRETTEDDQREKIISMISFTNTHTRVTSEETTPFTCSGKFFGVVACGYI